MDLCSQIHKYILALILKKLFFTEIIKVILFAVFTLKEGPPVLLTLEATLNYKLYSHKLEASKAITLIGQTISLVISKNYYFSAILSEDLEFERKVAQSTNNCGRALNYDKNEQSVSSNVDMTVNNFFYRSLVPRKIKNDKNKNFNNAISSKSVNVNNKTNQDENSNKTD